MFKNNNVKILAMIQWFLTKYNSEPLFFQKKVRLFVLINIIFIFILIFLPPFYLYVEFSRMKVAFILVLAAFIAIVVSLLLVRLGKYTLAANFLSLMLAAIILIGGLYDSVVIPQLTMSSVILYVPVTILISTLFSSIRWTIFIGLFSFTGISILHFFKLDTQLSGFSRIINRSNYVNSMAVGSLILFLAIIIIRYLTEHINSAEDEMEKNRQLTITLESKVHERTRELLSAMDELKVINANLVNAQSALWGEMQLAKKIQTVLLPKEPGITGYAVDAYMMPTDAVGGDYYDIINTEKNDWILIGDVSGHGISAGLIMMMVQTAVRVVLLENPEIQPSYLLKVINTMLRNNVKQMEEDKYMTLAAYCLNKNGQFIFSGNHEKVMIYRSEKHKVEIIDSPGIWVGITDDVKDFMQEDSFQMNKDDVMILYSDGVTEAKIFTDDTDKRVTRENYGEERIIELLLEKGHREPHRIREALIFSLQPFEWCDDVSFVILKKI